jgi:Asp-tRNA(Asn)/Glu-tRNA(Gln) amidotransferase A subunit family amidase
MTGNELAALSIADLHSLLRRRVVSPREVIDTLRERIAAVEPEIGA